MSLFPDVKSTRSTESTSSRRLSGFTRVLTRRRSHSFDDKDIFQEGKSVENPFAVPPISPIKDNSSHQSLFQSEKHTSPRRNILQRQRSKSFEDKKFLCKDNTFSQSSASKEKKSKSASERGESIDDVCVRISTKSLSGTDVVCPQVLCPQQLNSISRAERSFVRIQTELKTFTPRNETVAVAIFFEPFSLVYEVIILDVLDEEEVQRIYIYQREIIFQLRQRKTSMTLKNKLFSKKELTTDHLSVRKESIGQAKGHRRKRKSGQFQMKLMSSKWHMENGDDEENNDTHEEIDLDTIDIQSLERSSPQPLIFAGIIMKCIRSYRQHNKSVYCLVNDLTSKTFTCFSQVPDDLKQVSSATFDAKELITKARSISAVKKSTINLKKSVNCVDGYVDPSKEFPISEHEYSERNTRNPNQLKWRLMWQFAINAVMERNKARKRIRKSWGDLISQALEEKRQREEDAKAILRENKSGFRKLRVKTRRIGVSSNVDGECEYLQAVNEVANQYKEEMQARRKLKKEKTGIKCFQNH